MLLVPAACAAGAEKAADNERAAATNRDTWLLRMEIFSLNPNIAYREAADASTELD
jgi:hypothetical protein